MGNSEVGHTNIGAGRLVMQDLPRIDDAVATGRLKDAAAFRDLVQKAKGATGTVHLMGLVSPGGVHSHQSHIAALARDLADAGLDVWLHAFLDGRDTPPKSAVPYVETLLKNVAGKPTIRLATISGRYYAMDRDKRWERVAKAYSAIVDAEGPRFPDAKSAIAESYAANITDEFVLPCVIGDYQGMSLGGLSSEASAKGDALLFGNFRPDRAREISTAILDPGFNGFPRKRQVSLSAAAGLTEYSEPLRKFMRALFPPQDVTETIGEVFSERGLKQLRIAETEKYAHVTFFMNGGRERVFPGEDRILVPSPKVATYDLKPDMSANEVTDKLVEAVGSGKYDLIVCNYANPDMVGHTGIMPAAVAAVETIDACLGRLREAVEKAGGLLLLTADHGNIEMMRDPETGEPHTAHTLLDVPIIACGASADVHRLRLHDGRLADVAPTLLDLIGMEKPAVMTGNSLVVRDIRTAGAAE
jgi:2,3-bisphosphoglycerate-independent phosphoglycerate mutase